MIATGEPIIAYDLDRLFRSQKPVPAAEMSYSRSEASRIALAASGLRVGMRPEDPRLRLSAPCSRSPGRLLGFCRGRVLLEAVAAPTLGFELVLKDAWIETDGPTKKRIKVFNGIASPLGTYNYDNTT